MNKKNPRRTIAGCSAGTGASRERGALMDSRTRSGPLGSAIGFLVVLISVWFMPLALGQAWSFSDQVLHTSDWSSAIWASRNSESSVSMRGGGEHGTFFTAYHRTFAQTDCDPNYAYMSHIAPAAEFDPRMHGPILSVGFSIRHGVYNYDHGEFPWADDMGHWWAVEQDGVVYIDAGTVVQGPWATKSSSGLTAAMFSGRVSGTHPDFGANASPLRFGFLTGQGNGPGCTAASHYVETGFEDYAVSVAYCPLMIASQPESTSSCVSHSVPFAVVAGGSGPFAYLWQWRPFGSGPWQSISNGLNIDPLSGEAAFDAGGVGTPSITCTNSLGNSVAVSGGRRELRVVVSNQCGSVTSDLATWTICPGDFNCDGFVNGDDYDLFAGDFDEGNAAADINGDGFVNGDDYDAFAETFEAGC